MRDVITEAICGSRPFVQHVQERKMKVDRTKRHGAAKESRSELERFEPTEIIFSVRKNGGSIRGGLGGRSVLVVRQAGRQADENLVVLGNFKIL